MLNVSLVTPESLTYSGQCRQVTAPGWEGEFQVLPQHDTVLTALRAGLLTLTTGEGTRKFVIGRGFIEVNNNSVTILANSVVVASEADKKSAKTEMSKAEAELTKINGFSSEAELVSARLELARAKLEA